MAVIINEEYLKKAQELKKPLHKETKNPVSIIKILSDDKAFQKLKPEKISDIAFPLELSSGDEIIVDFGEHIVGYLNFKAFNDGRIKITDSPVKLHFTFGEFPLEIVTPPAEYKGGLGNGWLQNEEKSFVFTPYEATLERRYSFRYVKIKRTDTASFTVKLTSLSATSVCAVALSEAKSPEIKDQKLKKIYDISVLTLKECQQDVFEDGPKRDRRLWIGDLKLQAMTDYGVFRNLDLIKRCIYLFASATGEHKMVAPCIFPDSPPYVDEWTFCDYSLYFISCLYDWYKNTGDKELLRELFDVAYTQFVKVSEKLDKKTGIINLNPFIDWCPNLDKKTAALGVYIYTLKQLKELCEVLGVDATDIYDELKDAEKCLFAYYDKSKRLFTTPSGQISCHSQVWGILSGILSEEEAIAILNEIKKTDTQFTMRTPYMMHYYIEALYNCGQKAEALEFIKDYWGKIADAGFDCCPEIFNPANEFESPYNAPEINSACHAWSCTPAFWIPKLI